MNTENHRKSTKESKVIAKDRFIENRSPKTTEKTVEKAKLFEAISLFINGIQMKKNFHKSGKRTIGDNGIQSATRRTGRSI